MRNDRPRDPGAEHQEPRNQALEQVSTFSSTPCGAAAGTLAQPAVDAHILQSLRDRRRTDDAARGLAGEIVRLGTMAAGLHRAEVAARLMRGSGGTPIANPSTGPVVGCDGASPAEDAA